MDSVVSQLIPVTQLLQHGKYLEAKLTLEATYKMALEANDQIAYCHSLSYLVICCERLGDHIEALRYYKKLSALINLIQDKDSLIISLHQLSFEAQQLGNLEEAISYQSRALEYAISLNSRVEIVHCNARLGSLYQQVGNYEEALAHFEVGLNQSVELDLVDSQAQILHSVAGLNLIKNQLGEALNASLRAYSIYKELNNANGKLLTGLRTATVFLELNKISEAEDLISQLSQELKESNNLAYKITASMIYGKIEEKQSHWDVALERYHYALKLAQKSEKRRLEANTKAHIGKVLTEQGIHGSAINTLKDAISLSEQISDHYGIESSMELLAEAYERKGDTALALEAHKKYFNLYKKSADENADRRLKALQIKYEVDKKEKEAELYRLKLEKAEHELSMNTAHLVKQTEMLARFRDELRDIVRQHPASDPGWKAVKEKLKDLPCKQIDWEKFEAEFAAVHPEFTKKLYERYPTLTPMEVKMCSLLRLNLKSHEIARLFCVTERAVEFHRLNIRKKCAIPKEQSLSVFLNSL